MLDWSSVSTTRIVELVVDCIVALSATAAINSCLAFGAGLPAVITVPLVRALHGALLKLFCGFLCETFELALAICLYNFIVHDIMCSCFQMPQISSSMLATRHASFLTSTLDQMLQGNALPVFDL